MHLANALDRFITAKRATGRAETTISWYQIQIREFCDWLAVQETADWGIPETYELYYLHLTKRGLAPNSVRGAHRALAAFMAWLKKRKLITVNPMEDVEPPSVPKRQRTRATASDYDALLAATDRSTWIGLRDHLMISTLFLCGIRVAELTRLQIEDYDLHNKVLLIRRKKGGGDHTVPLLDPVQRSLVAYLYNRPVWSTGHVFLASAGGGDVIDGVLTTSGVRHRLTQLCRVAGIKRVTPHQLRHGLARYMLDHGADMALIQRILGHERMSTTNEIYAVWDNLQAVKDQYQQVMANLKPKR